MKRNATSRPPPEGALQEVRRGCTDLGQQVEGIAEQVVPVLRQATQELGRMEAQRDELRKTASRDAPPVVLPRLLERIEEQGQHVKRLERASRGLKELLSAISGLGEQLQEGLARQEEERREQDALVREEKRLWLRELLNLRQRAGGGTPTPSEDSHQAGGEETVRLRAERDGLAQRVESLERELATREQALSAKEQTLADLRRMIVLLSGDKAPGASPPPQPLPPPLSLPVVAAPVRQTPARGRQAVKASNQMFGNSTMALAHSMLETLGTEEEPSTESFANATRAPSMEIMLGPLDELEAGGPSEPPPVPAVTPTANQPAMAKAGARVPAPERPSVPEPPRPALNRPGTLVISEDMFSDMLVDENPPPTGRK
ncbi:hypothetical protein [Melittangium boletus]|uniref:Uncharacterized protein n=1 Tax=Melittangium boletus DSM 14713 TaxID=1294270 RepID=A0A250IGE4_9BACT|nr:hypothetical protein [Melittangium boletus]ATB30290.1 hypothetical protein MEBOL_003750 [Melittangium boletus DSM 14713]